LSLKTNVDFLRRLRGLHGLAGPNGAWTGPAVDDRLVETTDFGANPGELRMLTYIPQGLSGRIPLVVVLHGCTQSAAGYAVGAGWCSLAERYGFAVLTPEQASSNNSNKCFNWFVPEDIRRGGGEAGSIRQMVEHLARTRSIDRARIYVTGLSAGGAMAAVMLATYPDVFAGGAVIAGLPFGIAHNVRQALGAMRRGPKLPARELGELVRHATPHPGPWPKLSVWHGCADHTVSPDNAEALVRQWLDLHGLPETPMQSGLVDRHRRRLWWNSSGEPTVEFYTIDHMAHGAPLGMANDERYGTAGPFLIDAGISSSYHIANFFGLTRRIHRPQAQATPAPDVGARQPRQVASTSAIDDVAYAVKPRRDQTSSDAGKSRRHRGIDVGAVITRALTAAGLIK
jgi:poly(hydroxyalkanoate) depolymerase family esterase